MRFVARTLITAFALWAATRIVPGLAASGLISLLLAALLFGLVNAVIRPIAVMISLPLTVLTFGLFLFVVNAAMLGLVGWLLPGFAVQGFVPALVGSMVVSVVAWGATRLISGNEARG